MNFIHKLNFIHAQCYFFHIENKFENLICDHISSTNGHFCMIIWFMNNVSFIRYICVSIHLKSCFIHVIKSYISIAIISSFPSPFSFLCLIPSSFLPSLALHLFPSSFWSSIFLTKNRLNIKWCVLVTCAFSYPSYKYVRVREVGVWSLNTQIRQSYIILII